jgi:DNA-binding XRE family transcriptional regulator
MTFNSGDKVYAEGEVVSEKRGLDNLMYHLVLFDGARHPVPVAVKAIKPFTNMVREREIDLRKQAPAFRYNLRRLRQSRNLTQAEMARLIGVSQGAVWQWEHGQTVPRLDAFVKLCYTLGVGPAELMKEEE